MLGKPSPLRRFSFGGTLNEAENSSARGFLTPEIQHLTPDSTSGLSETRNFSALYEMNDRMKARRLLDHFEADSCQPVSKPDLSGQSFGEIRHASAAESAVGAVVVDPRDGCLAGFQVRDPNAGAHRQSAACQRHRVHIEPLAVCGASPVKSRPIVGGDPFDHFATPEPWAGTPPASRGQPRLLAAFRLSWRTRRGGSTGGWRYSFGCCFCRCLGLSGGCRRLVSVPAVDIARFVGLGRPEARGDQRSDNQRQSKKPPNRRI
jgi:hypothetical protein